MELFSVVVSDPPWQFSDQLKNDPSIKRGASSNYPVLDIEEIKKLPVNYITAHNALLALWVPSSLLQEGLDTMNAWGFKQKQTWIWIKEKKNAISENTNENLSFGMGRIFRNTHELVLVGTKGSIYSELKNHSQRTIFYAPIGKHSEKPEALQDQLNLMFPNPELKKMEMFARRDREGYFCLGNECPSSFGEDIRDSLKKIITK